MMPGVDDPIWQRIREETRSHARMNPSSPATCTRRSSTTTVSSVR
jgi:hypothetical protein